MFPDTVEMGTIESSGTLELDFELRNPGLQTVEIGEVRYSCNCIVGGSPIDSSLGPEESQSFSITVDTSVLHGEFQRYVFLPWSAGGHQHQSKITLRGYAKSPTLRCEPRRVYLGRFEAELPVRVYRADHGRLSIDEVVCHGEGFSVTMTDQTLTSVVLMVRGGDETVAVDHAKIEVRTSNPSQTTLEIPVHFLDSVDHIASSSKDIYLGAVRAGELCEVSFQAPTASVTDPPQVHSDSQEKIELVTSRKSGHTWESQIRIGAGESGFEEAILELEEPQELIRIRFWLIAE